MKIEKPLLSPGLYNSQNGPFRVDSSAMDNLVQNFHRMQRAGHRVSVFHAPQGADLSDYARRALEVKNSAGWLIGLRQQAGKLIGVLDIPDQADAETVKADTVKISPRLCEVKWTDGLGRTWNNFIADIGLVPRSVLQMSSRLPVARPTHRPMTDGEFVDALFRRHGR